MATGAARTRTVPECDAWEPERRAESEGRRFEGWVVELEQAGYLAGGRKPAAPRPRGNKRRRS
ncbi:hypothetical protein KIH74_22065 [Kineosporia sp. J2-2]|uniref:Uncharacterized protein n=1 Tax=Kineosporia corallincola TaxID=2835133 RepID=A0ABS5TN69_9ACTN|nr:hypothetical protein [Kineosporia corallincola]MBT0771641.1 hypothetical protein [Kineosporia corallincola]